MNHIKIKIDNIGIGERLDIFLSNKFPEYSRTYFSNLIKNKDILVNSSESKSNYKLKARDNISGELIEKTVLVEPSPEDIPLEIIFENNDVMVINKQPGIVVHPAAGHQNGTLINAILAHDPEIKNAVYDKNSLVSLLRPGLVHRLDKNTSGAIIIAKNARAMHSLSKQIQNRTVKKTYWAVCFGWPKNETGELTSFLGRHRKNRKLIAEIGESKGKKAILFYKVLEYYKDKFGNQISLIEFDLKTGRTHQIRVQMSDLGHPVLGDDDYGNKDSRDISDKLGISRQLLHAKTLKINLPGDSKLSTFEAPIPLDITDLLGKLTKIY